MVLCASIVVCVLWCMYECVLWCVCVCCGVCTSVYCGVCECTGDRKRPVRKRHYIIVRVKGATRHYFSGHSVSFHVMSVCLSVRVCACVFLRMCVFMCVCVYAYVHVCVFIAVPR